MKAIQLDLWSGAVQIAPSIKQESSGHDSAAHLPANPCLNCELKGLCPDDECGAVLYPLDGPTADFMTEEEYIELLKRNDLYGILDYSL